MLEIAGEPGFVVKPRPHKTVDSPALLAANPVAVTIEMSPIPGLALADRRGACIPCGGAVLEVLTASSSKRDRLRVLRRRPDFVFLDSPTELDRIGAWQPLVGAHVKHPRHGVAFGSGQPEVILLLHGDLPRNEPTPVLLARWEPAGGVAVALRCVRRTVDGAQVQDCLLYTSPSPRDRTRSRMPSSA